jgi:hypothetical protein
MTADHSLPLVLDPALAAPLLTIVHANGSPLIDSRTGRPFEFRSRRAALQQACALKVGAFRVAPLRAV